MRFKPGKKGVPGGRRRGAAEVDLPEVQGFVSVGKILREEQGGDGESSPSKSWKGGNGRRSPGTHFLDNGCDSRRPRLSSAS